MIEVTVLTKDEIQQIIRQAAHEAAEVVSRHIGANMRQDDELWDAEQVGNYLGVSAWTILYKWSHRRGFPRAITLGPGPKAKRRWKADEIRRWAERQKT